MVIEVFKFYGKKNFYVYFVFNIDGIYFVKILVILNLEIILFIVALKVF